MPASPASVASGCSLSPDTDTGPPVPDADVEATYRSSARAVSSVSLKRGTLTQASSS